MFKRILFIALILASLGFTAFTLIDSPKNAEVTSTEKEEDVNDEDAGVYEPVVVLELFTSQGCSSCPSADVILNKVKKQYKDEVFALSYHVDYWNYIGWEDPFSKPQYAKKQRAYNIKFKNRSNYTPQLVVNGAAHFVGSNKAKVNTSISQNLTHKASNKINLSNVKTEGNKVHFSYEALGKISGKNLKAVLVIDERITAVKRGENRNRTLTNSNIVVSEHFVNLENAKGKTAIKIPSLVQKDDVVRLMVFVEDEVYNITGAAKTVVSL